MRVLYVDDDRVNALLFVEVCRLAPGVEVESASSGEEALGMLPDFAPDLCVLDLHLPDTDGLALLPQLRHAAERELPAYLCTAEDDPSLEARAANAGFEGCWSKPLDLSRILAELRRLARAGPAV